jgi:hypothetical protein
MDFLGLGEVNVADLAHTRGEVAIDVPRDASVRSNLG